MYNSSILNSKIFKALLFSAVFLFFCVTPTLSFSQEKEAEGKEKPFDPKDAVFEHIGDSHSWHMFGKASLPLPIILYTDKGLEVFSSSHFEHGHADYAGKYYTYRLVKDKVNIVEGADSLLASASVLKLNKRLVDFSVTRNVASMWMGMIVLLIVFLSVSAAYGKRTGKAPKGLQAVMEPLVLFVRDEVAIPNIGVKYLRFMPLLLTIFFFILINNLLGLVPFFPGGFNLTGNIAVTLVLSVVVLVVINFSGNKYYWKHIFTPDIPLPLYIIMIPVEVIGIISKPFALMIRLFANITAGHIIVLSLISLIFIFKTAWMSTVSVPFVVFMDMIELLVAFLQAFIFTMLTALFIGMAVEEHHH